MHKKTTLLDCKICKNNKQICQQQAAYLVKTKSALELLGLNSAHSRTTDCNILIDEKIILVTLLKVGMTRKLDF